MSIQDKDGNLLMDNVKLTEKGKEELEKNENHKNKMSSADIFIKPKAFEKIKKKGDLKSKR